MIKLTPKACFQPATVLFKPLSLWLLTMVQFVTDMTPTLLIQPFSGKIAAPHISVCVPGLPTADNKSQVTEE